jgi:acetylornithine deacetylase/succinyl-diaminopimelate desuccinylase-like protein
MLVGRIDGGTNTNVVPGKVVMKMDRRMIPEEDPVAVEAQVRKLIEDAVKGLPGIRSRSGACCCRTRCARCRDRRSWWRACSATAAP